MFQESIADLTAAHLRTHIGTYLTDLQTLTLASEKLNLKVPDVSSTSLVGGVIQSQIDQLPILGVDCLDKDVVPNQESLFLYQYQGAIAGLVSATDETGADKLAKRYSRICEYFVREHQFLHEDFQTNTKPFTFREILYNGTRFSGTMEVEQEDEKIWIAGFVVEVIWITSESGERQH